MREPRIPVRWLTSSVLGPCQTEMPVFIRHTRSSQFQRRYSLGMGGSTPSSDSVGELRDGLRGKQLIGAMTAQYSMLFSYHHEEDLRPVHEVTMDPCKSSRIRGS